MEALVPRALALAEESTGKLARWLVLFEEKLRAAEERREPPDLKDFTNYLTALKRTLEVARLAQALAPPSTSSLAALTPEALDALLAAEDDA